MIPLVRESDGFRSASQSWFQLINELQQSTRLGDLYY